VTTHKMEVKNMEALEIYKKLSQPPKDALKEISEGPLKGKTDINPQWRYKAMTETFGLVGIGWKYEIQKLWTEPGANGETLAFAQVAVFVRDPDTKEWSDAIVGIGGSKLINKFNAGPKSNDEGYKMAVTDAFSTSLKMIGVAADIYAGRWDGSKYTESQSEQKTKSGTPQQNQQPTGPAGGPDTPAQKAKIKELLRAVYADGKQILTNEECKNVTSMRATKTADEVIKILSEKINARLKNQPTQNSAEPFPEDIPWDTGSEEPVF
jgi:hypothetical protein